MENSTSIGVRDEDAEAAAEVLNAEFAKEIETGAMFPMQVESGLATIAIVGENTVLCFRMLYSPASFANQTLRERLYT